ncbi:MAG: WD40 repeat domain-containing protein [Planctomycetes bacterium]|nr:WD40 repeat domain-containing protein [Planctomycetota bacterium]
MDDIPQKPSGLAAAIAAHPRMAAAGGLLFAAGLLLVLLFCAQYMLKRQAPAAEASPPNGPLFLGNDYVISAHNYRHEVRRSNTLRLVRTLHGPPAFNSAMAVNPEKMLVAAGFHDGTVCIWDVNDSSPLHTLKADVSEIRRLYFDKAGTVLLSLSTYGPARLWDTGTGECLWEKGDFTTDPVLGLRYGEITSDGRHVLLCSNDSGIYALWDVGKDRVVEDFKPFNHSAVSRMLFIDDTRILVSYYSSFAVFDLESGDVTSTVSDSTTALATATNGWVVQMVTSGSIYLRDSSLRVRMSVSPVKTNIVELAFSPGGRVLAVAERGSGTIRFYDLRECEDLGSVSGAPALTQHMDWSPDGRRLLAWGTGTRVGVEPPGLKAIETLASGSTSDTFFRVLNVPRKVFEVLEVLNEPASPPPVSPPPAPPAP